MFLGLLCAGKTTGRVRKYFSWLEYSVMIRKQYRSHVEMENLCNNGFKYFSGCSAPDRTWAG
jgi:hypothetical protein